MHTRVFLSFFYCSLIACAPIGSLPPDGSVSDAEGGLPQQDSGPPAECASEYLDAGEGCVSDGGDCSGVYDDLAQRHSALLAAHANGCGDDDDCVLVSGVYGCAEPYLVYQACSEAVSLARQCDYEQAYYDLNAWLCAQCRPLGPCQSVPQCEPRLPKCIAGSCVAVSEPG